MLLFFNTRVTNLDEYVLNYLLLFSYYCSNEAFLFSLISILSYPFIQTNMLTILKLHGLVLLFSLFL